MSVFFIKPKWFYALQLSDKANERVSVKTIRNTKKLRISLPFSSFFFFSPLAFPRLFLGAIFHSFGIEKTIKVSGTKYTQKKHKLGYSYNRLLKRKNCKQGSNTCIKIIHYLYRCQFNTILLSKSRKRITKAIYIYINRCFYSTWMIG